MVHIDLAAQDRLHPALAAVSENSSAQNMLLVSVTATAGMPASATSPGSFLHPHRALPAANTRYEGADG
jgi:hypothetical protein